MKSIIKNQIDTIIYFKNEIIISFIVYLIGFIGGVLIFLNKKLAVRPKNMKTIELLLNNTKTAILILFIGIVTAGIGSCIIMIINGAILGGVVEGAINAGSYDAIRTGIFLHAGFEIVALIFFMSISLETVKLVLNAVMDRPPKIIHLKFDIILFFDALFLLIIAALIEGNISYVKI
ncbi:stage II sporulation protein M [Lachnobacterium bovis]|uniref:Stage II sporulation protein M n=1 Tax=Lachnobacterium bovis DSM 14045 TaxID=1122142 RepID=A0A1H3GAJ3_9FIRM|nr:stage II sporulation protein M [Lachnobacterium bovis]SDY00077.1 Stage II sporulation protein M [Lachnobacterium bovis DSM 14045]